MPPARASKRLRSKEKPPEKTPKCDSKPSPRELRKKSFVVQKRALESTKKDECVVDKSIPNERKSVGKTSDPTTDKTEHKYVPPFSKIDRKDKSEDATRSGKSPRLSKRQRDNFFLETEEKSTVDRWATVEPDETSQRDPGSKKGVSEEIGQAIREKSRVKPKLQNPDVTKSMQNAISKGTEDNHILPDKPLNVLEIEPDLIADVRLCMDTILSLLDAKAFAENISHASQETESSIGKLKDFQISVEKAEGMLIELPHSPCLDEEEASKTPLNPGGLSLFPQHLLKEHAKSGNSKSKICLSAVEDDQLLGVIPCAEEFKGEPQEQGHQMDGCATQDGKHVSHGGEENDFMPQAGIENCEEGKPLIQKGHKMESSNGYDSVQAEDTNLVQCAIDMEQQIKIDESKGKHEMAEPGSALTPEGRISTKHAGTGVDCSDQEKKQVVISGNMLGFSKPEDKMTLFESIQRSLKNDIQKRRSHQSEGDSHSSHLLKGAANKIEGSSTFCDKCDGQGTEGGHGLLNKTSKIQKPANDVTLGLAKESRTPIRHPPDKDDDHDDRNVVPRDMEMEDLEYFMDCTDSQLVDVETIDYSCYAVANSFGVTDSTQTSKCEAFDAELIDGTEQMTALKQELSSLRNYVMSAWRGFQIMKRNNKVHGLCKPQLPQL
ncbi:uncharacterized protein LOC5514122 [Nematostella vectensis]|uniref:uncharacterized protein LOC5514122 n=1 Tax=Nematostella vectensis TaxID=45351 RepID=UPI00207777FD|nr:uncharacterized protein LOC5514122 [Nematostella vectensis]